MRPRDPLIPLEEVLVAGATIVRFLGTRSLADYEGDPVLQSAVERQFMIVGESLGRALRAGPELVGRLPEAPKTIALRNVLAHGHGKIVDRLVFTAAREELPRLLDRARTIIEESSET